MTDSIKIYLRQEQIEIDSLEKVLSISSDDTAKVQVLLMVGSHYIFTDLQRIKYFEEALLLSQKLSYRRGIVKANQEIGRTHNFLSYYEDEKKDYLIKYLVNKFKSVDTLWTPTFISELMKVKEKEVRVSLREKDVNVASYLFLGITILLMVVALSLLLIYRQRNRVRNEKKRSDELLLNILPAETAEELKATGSAKAKGYDEVTVMFTDFKNFTQVAERLTVEELVGEINFCYSEFDRIISRHGIEKIKTIGDSYMCAGGLPVANKTNAVDTVKAAIEIQIFMQHLKEVRISEGRQAFELRLGVHTGPVVAGIVGIKKFAYDIWGDTVNIASRMESSGEVGKVNISESTYELVKEMFVCTRRGKIEAKNKGMIDMFFVEGLLTKEAVR